MDLGIFHLYLACLLLGLGYVSLISITGLTGDGDGCHHDSGGGDVDHGGGDSGPDVDGHAHADSGHASDGVGSDGMPFPGLPPFSPLMLATFATLFGGLGFVTLGILSVLKIPSNMITNTLSLIMSGALSVVFSSYISLFLVKIFIKSEANSNISARSLIGQRAEVILTLEPGKLGEVAYSLGGTRQTNMAKLVDGSPEAKKGQLVEIVSLNENVIWVKTVEESTVDEPKELL